MIRGIWLHKLKITKKLNIWQFLFNILPLIPVTKPWINSSFSTECPQRGQLKLTVTVRSNHTSFPLPKEVQTNQGVCRCFGKPHLQFLHYSLRTVSLSFLLSTERRSQEMSWMEHRPPRARMCSWLTTTHTSHLLSSELAAERGAFCG